MVMAPLGLWYLAAQLEAQGHATDFRALDVDELPQDGEYDQLWLSATSAQMGAADIPGSVRGVAEVVKDWQDTRIVFGGAAPWTRPAVAEQLPFDLVVAGEAEDPGTGRGAVEEGGR